MKLKIYQVDAFTNRLFGGNPAAVCLLNEWLSEELMQHIATENNLAETAFLVKNGNEYGIRWFTPAVEVDLCGHATLASAHALFNHCNYEGDEIIFNSSISGILKVRKSGPELMLDFPADVFGKVDALPAINKGLGVAPIETYKGKTDYMAVLQSQEELLNIRPDFDAISKLDGRGLIVTAKGVEVDFVSRFFAPQSGINEDPVTGSAHTTLTPYWSKVLGKDEMTAIQMSARKGHLRCRNKGDRVEISGNAVTYLVGEIGVER